MPSDGQAPSCLTPDELIACDTPTPRQACWTARPRERGLARPELAGALATPDECGQQRHRRSVSMGTEAGTDGSTTVTGPLKTEARWKGAKRGARSPALISRGRAERVNAGGGGEGRRVEVP